MGWSDWNAVYSRDELEPIDKFKNKSRLLKAFGPNAVRIYNSFDGAKRAVQVQAALSLNPDEFSKILDFMLTHGMISKQDTPSSGEGEEFAEPSPVMIDETETLTPPKENLSPMEKTIFEKYGEVGLKVYSLIDGERTAEQILNETGVSETKLVEMLEFMNEKGIIKLERPGKAPPPSSRPPPRPRIGKARGPSMPSSRMRTSKQKEEPIGFEPMVEPKPVSDIPRAREDFPPDMIPVDVPVILPNISFIKKAQISAILSLKFGKVGNMLLKYVDGERDFVQIAIESGLALSDLDIILGELGKNNLIQFKQLTRTELRHRYGDDGLNVYKMYGRDGILIYQLIGKSRSIADIINKSKLETEKAIDIIIFVHKMLGLDITLDRDMIYRYISKERRA
ncbi:MAG: hypothetical protein ABIH83_03720 [Candidatus Micrarchaeota archaeon]